MTQIDLFLQQIGEEQSSQQAIHVNPSALQEVKKVSKTTGTSGRSFLELLHKKDPLYAFSKMLMVILPWDSTRFSMTWKVKATPRGRLLFQLFPQALPTEGIESGLSPIWATPNTMDHLPQRSKESTRKMQEGHRKGRKRPSNLREQVDTETSQMWPTPTTEGYGHA